jgi:hypothetical protein
VLVSHNNYICMNLRLWQVCTGHECVLHTTVYREKIGTSEGPFTICEIADPQTLNTDENEKLATFNVSQNVPYILPSDQSCLEDIVES